MKNEAVFQASHRAVVEVAYRGFYDRKHSPVEGTLYWSLNRMMLRFVRETLNDSPHPGLNRYLAKVGR